MAQIYQIGLDKWTGGAETAAPRPLPLAARDLCWLGDSPLSVKEESWRGRKVMDRRGRTMGRVRDLLVEVRSTEEAARAGGRSAWGVRAVYAAVAARRGWRWWAKPREVLVAVGRLDGGDTVLRADVDAVELWPRLLGRVIA